MPDTNEETTEPQPAVQPPVSPMVASLQDHPNAQELAGGAMAQLRMNPDGTPMAYIPPDQVASEPEPPSEPPPPPPATEPATEPPAE